MKHLLLLVGFLILISGCSSKKYYEPKESKSGFPSKTIESSITKFNKDFANTKEGQFVGKQGFVNIKIKDGLRVINADDKAILAIDTNSSLSIIKDNVYQSFYLEHQVIGATLKDNLLAVIFSDNSIAIYDTNTKKFTFKEYLTAPLACDDRISNPKFMTDIVLFPVLDGKIVVVGLDKNEKVRDILVDPEGQFNNIIYINTIDNMLIAATRNKIISIGAGNFVNKELEIVDVVSNDNKIFVATLDGQVISFNSKLEKIHSSKHKYAKIVGLAATSENVYALESQGYLIKSKKDFSNHEIYSVSIYDSDKIFSNDSNIIIGDTELVLQ